MAVVTGAVVGAAALASQVKAGNDAGDMAREARYSATAQSAGAQAMYEQAAQRLEDMGIPPAEAQRIVLESPELVGLQDIHELGASQFEGIETDPRLKEAQMGALSKLEEFGGAGLTEAEKAESFLMQRQVAGEEQSRQKSILQDMAQRGVSGSGIELAARLGSSQASAERRAMAQAQLAGQAQQRALQAITQGAGLAGNVRGQEFGEQAQAASASDRIAQFNTAQRAQIEAANLNREQNIEQQRAGAAQQQEIHNKALIQQEFQNQMGKEQAIAAARTGTAQNMQQQASNTLKAGQAAAAGKIAQGAAIGNLASGLIGAAAKFDNGSPAVGTQTTGAAIPATQVGAPINPSYTTGGLDTLNAKDGGLMHSYEDGGQVPSSAYISAPNSNGGFAGGGFPVPDDSGEEEEMRYLKGDIIPGDDFEGDRVDAKVNSGEMVLNIEQQQRLMDMLKGYRDLAGLGDENIVEPADKFEPVAPEGIPEELIMKDGGVAHQEEKHTKDYGELARGLTQEYSKMNSQSDQMKEAQKNTGARIKALETLMGIEKKK